MSNLDIKEVDETADTDDDEEGVIDLPGGPDDELDIEYMFEVLAEESELETADEGMYAILSFKMKLDKK